MKRTSRFDALISEPPLEAIPNLRRIVEVKHFRTEETLDGSRRFCVGHEAIRATELEQHSRGLKIELDTVVVEA